MRSSRDADDIRLRLKLLRRTGAGLGLGRGRIWIRLNDSAASRRQFPQTATIEELIGINDDDMKAAYGDNWRAKAFKDDPNAKLRRGFKYASKGRGFFVSVISDKDEDKESAAPDRLAVARDDEVDKILNQVKAGYNLADRPTSRKAPSTAAPLCSKPAAGSKRKDFSGKNNGHVGAPPPSKKTKTSAAAALGSADDPRKVSPSTAKKDDIAVMHSKNVAAAKEVLSGLVGMGSNLKKVTGQKLRSAEAVPGAELEITATVEAQTTNQQGYLGREDEEFDMLGGLNDQWIDGIATELMAFVKDKIRSSDKQTAPDVLVQSVASVAISRLLEVQESTDGVFELKSTASNGRVETNKFLKIPRVRRVKTGSRAESQKKYVRKKAQFLEGLINTMSHAESASSKRLTKNIIKNLGRRFDLTVVEKDSVELAPHEVVTLRDTAGIGTNATYRFASALQALRPELDLFPPAVKAVLAMFEKTDNFDMGLELLHLQVNKDATKKRLLPFVWVKRVWHVIQSMIESSTADETFERSEDFMRPLFKGKVAVTYNIDKGGDDIMVSIRLVNRSSGNSMKFTFPIATVGGPLMENYENELESIFNEKFPIGRTLQHLVDDSLFVLRLRQGSMYPSQRCRCIVFRPKEQKKKKTVRNIEAELLEECVNESAVQFDDEESDEGLTPEVEIPVDATKLSVRLVTRQNELKTCVGVQILHEGNVIHSRRFAKAVGRTKTSLSKRWTMRAQFMQVVGFPAHDMKQQLVLAGIPSNSCKRPCPHCTEEDGNFNAKHCTTRMFNAIKRKKPSISPVAPKDPVTRTGTQWSTSACAQRYNEEVGTGTIPSRVHQSSVNERCASVTKPPLIDEHGKNSGEPTHMSMGVANKHNEKIRRYCREIDMKLPFYQLVVETSKEVEKTLRGLLSLEAKESSSALAPLHRESNKFRTELNRVLRLSEQLEKEISESDSADSRADLEDEIICLQERADDILKQCQAHSKNTQYGHLVQLQVGLLSFHDALEKFLKHGGLRPRGPIEFAFVAGLEHVGGGRFNKEHGGHEMTNQSSLNTLEHFDEICDLCANVLEPGSPFYDQVKDTFELFREVGDAVFEVAKDMKRQDRLDADEFDEKLADLVIAWDAAYPNDQYINKMHYLLTHLSDFIDKFGICGRASAESHESIHAKIQKAKEAVARMPSMLQKYKTLYARSMSNLKHSVANSNQTVAKKMTGKKRGNYISSKVTKQSEELDFSSTIFDGTVSVENVDYLIIKGGGRIPKKHGHIYVFVKTGRAPNEWVTKFEELAALSETKLEKMRTAYH